MGLRVSIYRDSGSDYDCTNGGISSKFTELTLVNVPGPFDPTPDAPAAILEAVDKGSARIVPVFQPEGTLGPMFGGNYAASSDSRFRKAAGIYGAVAIHDRFETWEMYEMLSQ